MLKFRIYFDASFLGYFLNKAMQFYLTMQKNGSFGSSLLKFRIIQFVAS